MKKLLNMVLKQIDTIGCLWYKKIKAINYFYTTSQVKFLAILRQNSLLTKKRS